MCHSIVVRESCYPFYEPSYTELSYGCSQEVQFTTSKTVRILRTQEERTQRRRHQETRERKTQELGAQGCRDQKAREREA
jgi:hypothetical protein